MVSPVCQSNGTGFLLFPLNYLEHLHVLRAERNVAHKALLDSSAVVVAVVVVEEEGGFNISTDRKRLNS